MSEQVRPPAGIDITRANAARVYDYCLFGQNNYEVDRETARRGIEMTPGIVWAARENRAWLGRVVRYLAESCGITQFLDHGSGLPTRENVHQVAQRYVPDSRVVYIDREPEVLAYGRALLADNDNTTVITADMAHADEILRSPEVRRLIDFDQPVGVLYISVLHCLPDSAKPWDAVARTLDAVPSGSYLALSHLVSDDKEFAEQFTRFANAEMDWGRVRHPDEVSELFDGLEVVEPGLGDIAKWRLDLGPALLPRPDSPENPVEWGPAWRDDVVDPNAPKQIWEHGGVARKP